MKSMRTVLEYTRDWDHEVKKALDRWNWRSRTNSEYQATHQRIVQKYNIWVPDLFDEIDLLLAYHTRFSHFRSFAHLIEDLRHWYVYEVYQIGDSSDSARHTVEGLEHMLGKIAPHIKLTDEQRDYLRKYLAANGTISYKALTQYLGVEFEGAIQNELITFLNVRLEPYTESVPETLGIPKLSGDQKRRLDEHLDQLRKNFDQRNEKIQQENIEVPAVFEKSPPLIKFALISYFKQLTFGEREAVLADFKTEGLTEEQALKKFFEVTGNEKLGQFLSLRRDLIPERFRKELERFQENVEPSAFEEVKSTIEKELGAPIDSLFRSINPKPLKVGTIGEVYEVTLLDGTRAIVKVITPSKRKAIEQNLARIRVVAFDIDRNKSRFEQKVDVLTMFREFERTIREELDLTIEYQNAKQFSTVLPAGISIPTFYEQYVWPSVLVQSFVEGQNPLEVSGPVQKSVATKLGAMLIDQVLTREIYHDDLHPGNIRVDAKGNIILLDFGRVGRLASGDRETIVPLLLAINSKDANGILSVLEKMGTPARDYDREGLKSSIKKIVSDGLSTTNLISSLFYESGNHGLEIRGVFLQLIKGILTFEGTAHRLDPTYSLENQVKSIAMQSLAKSFLGNLFGGWKRSEARNQMDDAVMLPEKPLSGNSLGGRSEVRSTGEGPTIENERARQLFNEAISEGNRGQHETGRQILQRALAIPNLGQTDRDHISFLLAEFSLYSGQYQAVIDIIEPMVRDPNIQPESKGGPYYLLGAAQGALADRLNSREHTRNAIRNLRLAYDILVPERMGERFDRRLFADINNQLGIAYMRLAGFDQLAGNFESHRENLRLARERFEKVLSQAGLSVNDFREGDLGSESFSRLFARIVSRLGIQTPTLDEIAIGLRRQYLGASTFIGLARLRNRSVKCAVLLKPPHIF